MDNNGPAYYYYKGSLTTPECNEVVNWIVMENTISISEYQVRHSNPLQASYQKFGETWHFQIVNFQKLQAI
jgi:carbonic anhydrase